MRPDFIDCKYEISEERLRAYAKVPEIERLRWLDELVRFTLMFREAELKSNIEANQAKSTVTSSPTV